MSSEIKTNVISEVTSGSGVSIDGLKVKDSALVTDTNKYAFVKSGELNSLGYLNQNFFGASYFLSTAHTFTGDESWSEVGSASSGLGRWTKIITTGASGSDDADPFAKFNGTTGRFTPTISGYYQINFALNVISNDNDEYLETAVRKNASTTNGELIYGARIYATGTNRPITSVGSGILGLDTNDYLSLYTRSSEGGDSSAIVGVTTISFFYLGTSDL
tara:strand:- start:3199 stop:3852 length:654 start_codon:yes stop_codon:yes gene_type:complete